MAVLQPAKDFPLSLLQLFLADGQANALGQACSTNSCRRHSTLDSQSVFCRISGYRHDITSLANVVRA
jgi:hypothetical protein